MSDSTLLTSSDSYRQLDKLRNAEAVQIQDELAFSQEMRKLVNGGEVRRPFELFLELFRAQTDKKPPHFIPSLEILRLFGWADALLPL